MPFYEYRCARCGHQVTQLVQAEEAEPARCEACGRAELRRLVSAFNVRARRAGDARTLEQPGGALAEPGRYTEAARSFAERAGVSLSDRAVNMAAERLAAAKGTK